MKWPRHVILETQPKNQIYNSRFILARRSHRQHDQFGRLDVLGWAARRSDVLVVNLGVVERRSEEKEVKVRASNYPSGKLFVPPPSLQPTHGSQSPDDNRRETNDRSQSPRWKLPHRNGLWAGPCGHGSTFCLLSSISPIKWEGAAQSVDWAS